MSLVHRVIGPYREVVAVGAAAAAGLSAGSRLRWLDHHGIDTLLAVLVFATAVTVPPAALGAALSEWRRLVVALVVGATVLPVLAWAAARLVSAGPGRDGVISIGLAPCEIASVATTGMAGGAVAAAAGILILSTLLAVALAGPLLTVEAGSASVHPAHIIANLGLVVALPLIAGLALRATRGMSARAERTAQAIALGAVAALVGLIASEVHLGRAELAVLGAISVFLVGSAMLGWVLGRGAGPPEAVALLLTTSMRDFAVAAGLATSAFGATAAAPLGVYGIVVLMWGTGVAGVLRRHPLGRHSLGRHPLGRPAGPGRGRRANGTTRREGGRWRGPPKRGRGGPTRRSGR